MDGLVPILEGYLKKKHKSMLRRWRKKYFVLKPPFFEYWAFKGEAMRGIFNLENASITWNELKPNQFKLNFGWKTLSLKASSEDEANMWIDKLLSAIPIKKS